MSHWLPAPGNADALLTGIPELVVDGVALGIKNKVLEASCAGTPVVANPTAVDGVEGAVAGEHFVLADGADETARAIRGLFADPTRRMELAHAARDLVVSSYTWERRADQLFEAYGLAAGT